jgi:hypothetical protein
MGEEDRMDRRTRIREYKETARPMGVFRVRNRVNGRFLVGSSVDVPSMLNRIRFQLGAGSFPDRALQADWKESGADAFELETLDLLEPSEEPGHDPAVDLRALEQLWLEKLGRPGEPGYH